MKSYRGYVEALEMERVKMLVFQRELPLSIELVSRVIERYRQRQRSDFLCEETTSNERETVLDFLPIKESLIDTYASSPENENHIQDLNLPPCLSEKSEGLRPVQLWSQTPDLSKEPSNKESDAAKKGSESSSSDHLEELEKSGGSEKDTVKEENAKRKQRRCWSQELHRRFLHSLQQLGGAQFATPKQIRELMNVDGLTNDEVKSHLQKYRLHTRRPTLQHNQENAIQAPQFVVMEGIWVPSSDYPTMPKANMQEKMYFELSTRNGVYAPMPTPLGKNQWHFSPKVQIEMNSEGHALAQCNSPTRTTASPIY